MRIFYASGEVPNQALPGSRVWRNNLYLSLVDLGHDVVEFRFDLDPLLRHADVTKPGNAEFVAEHRPLAERALLEQIEAAHREDTVDLFFSYFYSVCARPEVIRRVRDMGIRTMNWFCNASYQFHLVEEIAPAYDWSLVPELDRLEDYRRAGANPLYCQEAANPLFYHPVAVPRDLDVVFVGARYGERPQYLRRLWDEGVRVTVFGPGWRPRVRPSAGRREAPRRETPVERWRRRLSKLRSRAGWVSAFRRLRSTLGGGSAATVHASASIPAPPTGSSDPESRIDLPPEAYGGVLSDDEMVEVYSRAKISLGLSSVGNTGLGPQRIVQVRLRDFEAPMSGAFYLVECIPELGRFFEVGSEVACYSDLDDLVKKARHYLDHEDQREQIRLAGQRRALADHTWQKRFTSVFEQVGLPARGPDARRDQAS